MDQRRGAPWPGPISMARVAGQVSPLREERATARRPEADLLPLTTWCWCSESPWPGLGTGRARYFGTSERRPRSPLAGARGCCIGPDKGPGENERLDKPRLRTGDSRDLSGPLWWLIQAVDGPREAEGDGESTLLGARGRWPLGHPNPLNPEAGVKLRAYSPDGVIAVEERRSCACSSTRAGNLHPASTSQPGVSPNEA